MVPWGYRLGHTLSLATLAACLRVPMRLHAYGLQKRRRCSALCVVRRAGRLANPPSASRSSSGRRRQSGCASVFSVAAVVATFLALSAFTAAMHHTHARFLIISLATLAACLRAPSPTGSRPCCATRSKIRTGLLAGFGGSGFALRFTLRPAAHFPVLITPSLRSGVPLATLGVCRPSSAGARAPARPACGCRCWRVPVPVVFLFVAGACVGRALRSRRSLLSRPRSRVPARSLVGGGVPRPSPPLAAPSSPRSSGLAAPFGRHSGAAYGGVVS